MGGLKDPLEVRVEDATCRTIHGTHLEGILSQKNWTGLAGGVKNGHFLAKIWLLRPPWAPLNHVSLKLAPLAFLCSLGMLETA